jgi:hypothetical protein
MMLSCGNCGFDPFLPGVACRALVEAGLLGPTLAAVAVFLRAGPRHRA